MIANRFIAPIILPDMWQDLRFALRTLSKARAFTALCVAMLALGIGGDTAAFSILNGALLRPLPYRDPARLIDVLDESRRESRLSKLFSSAADFREYRRHARSFEQVAAVTWAYRSSILSGHGPSRQVFALPASDNFFATLGVAPALGRDFRPEDATHCVVILSHAYWSESFGSDPAVPGSSIALDREPCTVAGVMPATFAFYPPAAQMWRMMPPDLAAPVFIVGRLRAGVSRAAAQAEFAGLHSGIEHADAIEREFTPAVSLLQDDFTWLAGRNLRATLWILMAAVSLVLLIACLNIANLFLGRSLVRSRELAVRAALGGGRGRLVRLLFAEGLVLAAGGGGFGVALAFVAVRSFRAVNPIELPAGAVVQVSLPALAFAAGVSVLTAVLFALAPAWRFSRVDLRAALNGGGRSGIVGGGRSRAARTLVAVEIALSLVLLAGAGLLGESVLRMRGERLGFEPEGLYYAGFTLPQGRYTDSAARLRIFEQLQAKVNVVGEVALGSAAPPFYSGNYALEIFGNPQPSPIHDVTRLSIDPPYLRTLRIALRRGRGFDAHDRDGAEPVAIVNEALAREYFPSSDPIGQRIRIAGEKSSVWAIVVGIAASVKTSTVFHEMGWIESPAVYLPMAQQTSDSAVLVVRTARAASVRPAVEDALRTLDPDAAVGYFEAVETGLGKLLSYPRFRAAVLAAFAAFALLLAAAGLYAVLSQLVARRGDEIAVRIALGALPRDIVRMVVRDAAAPVFGGVVCGLTAALACGNLAAALLYNVAPRDPALLGGASIVLLAAAALATVRPAQRAARRTWGS
jgi:putative ABC transport system permease protein